MQSLDRTPRKDRPFVDILFLALKGGSGATWGADGYDHIGLVNCAGGILAQDYEMFEIQNPFRLTRHEYLTDSAGPGRWRGGLGIDTEFLIDGDEVMAVAFGDGIEEDARAFGLAGGGRGSINHSEIAEPDGTVRVPKSKQILRDIPRGAVFRQQAGGGGGYGDPFARPPEKVAEEVRNEFISVDSARRDYGVAMAADGITVDAVETARLRDRARKQSGA